MLHSIDSTRLMRHLKAKNFYIQLEAIRVRIQELLDDPKLVGGEYFVFYMELNEALSAVLAEKHIQSRILSSYKVTREQELRTFKSFSEEFLEKYPHCCGLLKEGLKYNKIFNLVEVGV